LLFYFAFFFLVVKNATPQSAVTASAIQSGAAESPVEMSPSGTMGSKIHSPVSGS
jgi:hypothetical protein